MFIRPKCNSLVADPEFVPAPAWWRRPRGPSGQSIPVCPSGHKLRNQILGNLTELSLTMAFLRGLCFSGLGIALGILQDSRLGQTGRPPPGLMAMARVALVVGVIALIDAWHWAGMAGPAQRLATRAVGMAFGSLILAIIDSHALYFHWADSMQIACAHDMFRLTRSPGL